MAVDDLVMQEAKAWTSEVLITVKSLTLDAPNPQT